LEVDTSEANKALAKLWFEEVWNEGRRETIRELLAAEAVIQEGNDASVGPEGFYPFFHTRHGVGIPPTNKTLQTTGIAVLPIAGGKFVAWWQNWDMLGLMQQIKDEPMGPTYIAAKVGRARGI
jgi:hypothetical protein